MTVQGKDTLHQEALERYREYVDLGRRTVRAAWLAGQALNRVRQHLPHGQWLAWLQGAGIARSTAYRLVAVYLEYPEGTSQLGKFASVTSALEEAADRRPKARRTRSSALTKMGRLVAENDVLLRQVADLRMRVADLEAESRSCTCRTGAAS